MSAAHRGAGPRWRSRARHTDRRVQLARVLRAYAIVVLVNYAAQVPYALDLYGTRINLAGAALLAATLAWFAVAYASYVRGNRIGYPLLVAYAAAQVAFYFHGQVLLAFSGYGLPYALTHAPDAIVWLVFVIGDVNFIAAIVALGYLLISGTRFSVSRAGKVP